MPLVDLKTSLKNLKFGKDRRGGGNSAQPYETFSIPDDHATPLVTDFWVSNDNSLDYPMRGGGLTSGRSYSLSGQIDKDRISKFFKDSPRGTAFIQKQIGLQRSNPKMETGTANVTLSNIQTLLGSLGATFGFPAGLGSTYGAGGNNLVYNAGRNTLAQVLSSGTGVHIPRAGATPINLSAKYYTDIVGSQIYTKDDITKVNRLLILQSLKLRSNLRANQAVKLSNPNALATATNFGISTRAGVLFDYLGGPGSTYGDGSTIIRRSTNSSDGYDLTQRRPDLFPGVFTMAYDQIKNQSALGVNVNGVTLITDFQSQFNLSGSKSTAYNPLDGVDYRFYYSGVDKLNATFVSNTLIDSLTDPFNKEYDDIIKFGFECMSNDQFGYSVPLVFRAFLNKGINDSNTAQLNSFKYMGRGETFYTYQGFEKSISFGFKIVAFSKNELLPLYNKLNYLVSQVYPDYSTNGVMRAPLIKLTIGDYVYRMPGFLSSINLSIDINAPWDLNENGDTLQVPKVIDIDIEFKPIFNTLPQREIVRPLPTPTPLTKKRVTGNPEFFLDKGSFNRAPFLDNIPNLPTVPENIKSIVPQIQQNTNVPFIGAIISNK